MNEESLIVQASEIADPSERADFLRRACGGDEALLHRVQGGIRPASTDDDIIDMTNLTFDDDEGPETVTAALTPEIDDSGTSTLTDERTDEALAGGVQKPGDVIGPYTLVRKLGEGGMGVVFEAQQEKPVRRKVALKVIKAGMDTRQVVSRFNAERQALAIMDHPGIAHVLDAGATDTGRRSS